MTHPLRLLMPLLLVPLLLGGCAQLQKVAETHKPTAEVAKVRVTDLNFEAVDLAFDVRVENPNPVAVKLAGFDYNLNLNRESFLKGEQDKPLSVAANQSTLVVVPLTLGFSEIYRTLEALKGQDRVDYQLDLGLKFDLPVLGAIRLPTTATGSLPLPQMPAISVADLRLDNLTMRGADLVLEVAVDNPNGFSFLLDRLDYSLNINGVNWAEGTNLQRLQVAENGSSRLAIPLSLNFLEAGRSAYQALTGGGQLDYQFQAQMEAVASEPLLGRFTLPYQNQGQVSLSR